MATNVVKPAGRRFRAQPPTEASNLANPTRETSRAQNQFRTTEQSQIASSSNAQITYDDKKAKYSHLRLAMLAFGIGAASAQEIDGGLKSVIRRNNANPKTPIQYYRLVPTTTIQGVKVPDLLTEALHTTATTIPLVSEVLTNNVSASDALDRIKDHLEGVRVIAYHYAYPPYVFMGGALVGIKFAGQPDVTIQNILDLISKLIPSANDLTDFRFEELVIKQLMVCIALISKAITEHPEYTNIQLADTVGQILFYFANSIYDQYNVLGTAIFTYFKDKWDVSNTGQISFKSAYRAYKPYDLVSHIMASAKAEASNGDLTYVLVGDLLFCIDVLIYGSNDDYLVTVFSVSFIPALKPHCSALVGGWYGLKYGITDQVNGPTFVRDLTRGVPSWAVNPVRYNTRRLVDACELIFPNYI